MLRSTSCWPNAPSHSHAGRADDRRRQSGNARLHAQGVEILGEFRLHEVVGGMHERRPLTAPEPSRAAGVVDDGCAWLTPRGSPDHTGDERRTGTIARGHIIPRVKPIHIVVAAAASLAAAVAAQPQARPFDLLITNARIIDGTGVPVSGRIGRGARRAHRGRRPGVGRGGADHRRPRPCRRPWVHRSALAFRLLAADRRERREQDPAGRDHRGHRRERFSRAAEADRRAGLERFHGLLLGDRARQDVGQPAFVCRPGPGPRVRDGQRRARSENGGARAYVAPRGRCDETRRLRRGHRPDLLAQRVRQDRRADRALAAGQRGWRPLRIAPALRRREAA